MNTPSANIHTQANTNTPANAHLRGNVLAKACPSRGILEHLTSRWGVLVLITLQDKRLRFSEIRRQIEGISERMLTQTLQNLEQDGMLIRHDYQTVPPKVDYQLSELGQVAAGKIHELVDWLELNLHEIVSQSKSTR